MVTSDLKGFQIPVGLIEGRFRVDMMIAGEFSGLLVTDLVYITIIWIYTKSYG